MNTHLANTTHPLKESTMKYIIVNTTYLSFDNAIADGDYIISSVPTLPVYCERGEIRSLKGKFIICNDDGYLLAVKNKNYRILSEKELGLVVEVQNLLRYPVFTVECAAVVFEGYLKHVSLNG